MGPKLRSIASVGLGAPVWRSDMRLAAIASALAIVLCVAVFGAIFLQRSSDFTSLASAPAPTAPTEGRAPGAVVRAVDNPVASPAAAAMAEAPRAVAQAPAQAPLPAA